MSFTLDLKNAVRNIEEDTEKVVRGTLVALAGRVIKGTPVAEPATWNPPGPSDYLGGTLRGAWNASIGSIDGSKHGKRDEGGGTTISDAAQEVLSLTIGQTFYLHNPQPYAARVENGWSKQAPQGMLRLAIAATQKELNKQISEL